jgi:hypothetical protein
MLRKMLANVIFLNPNDLNRGRQAIVEPVGGEVLEAGLA